MLSTQVTTFLSSLSTHPLVSAAAAAYVLGALYLPRRLLSLVISPVPISSLFLLALLLRSSGEPNAPIEEAHLLSRPSLPDPSPDTFFPWPRCGPLEIIYEEEEYDDDDDHDHDSMMGSMGDDSSCASSWGSWPAFEWPERLLLESEEEEGMIEIALEEDNLIEIDISGCR